MIFQSWMDHDFSNNRKPPAALFAYNAPRHTLRIVDTAPWSIDKEHGNQPVPPGFGGYAWSPDGKYIVYSRIIEARAEGGPVLNASLFIAMGDGLKKQQLTRRGVWTYPAWPAHMYIEARRTFIKPRYKEQKVEIRLVILR